MMSRNSDVFDLSGLFFAAFQVGGFPSPDAKCAATGWVFVTVAKKFLLLSNLYG
jgi:hypothetical protein